MVCLASPFSVLWFSKQATFLQLGFQLLVCPGRSYCSHKYFSAPPPEGIILFGKNKGWRHKTAARQLYLSLQGIIYLLSHNKP
ncbi:Hypothetical predicted protein [Podarcis lilfordi]|uniref:Uncharacterized protein n=1 Tax=Podarcis lilfordi TaxID=74358 RepID=A0AA35JPD6_9SAUR|nr:Hypothetical predicted protein [Podarcis lilfordi]